MQKSPCIRICTLNADKICIGCGRTAHEIQSWSTLSDEAKQDIGLQLNDRLSEILMKMRTQRNELS